MKIIIAALFLAALLPGCATITTGQNQSVSVETRKQGGNVVGASCKLANDKGTWFVTTPGSVTVSRAYGDMSVNCTHEKHEPGGIIVKSSTKAMAFGNIIAGGLIGAAVDIGTGSAYDYPNLITVEMGSMQAPAQEGALVPTKAEAPPAAK
jgi:hypothetical protein